MQKRLRIRRPDLIVEDPWTHVLHFFAGDGSSTAQGAYDAYVASGKCPANRIVADDITVINATMSARSPHSDWADLVGRGTLSELAEIDLKWDLFLTRDKVWSAERIPERLEALFEAVICKGIGIARASKVLHMKRPRLIPICDSYVLKLMAIPGNDGASGVALIQHLRTLRSVLLPTLRDLRGRLRKRGFDPTLVRITDGLIWGSYPDTWVQRHPKGASPKPV